MNPRLDHVVILVEDLDRATDRYEEFGFTVAPGGVHTGGLTQNAIIPFEDGTYLELLGFTWATAYEELRDARESGSLDQMLAGRTPLDRRFLPLGAEGPGLADCAIACDSITSVVQRAGETGVSVEGPVPGSRIKPDGTRIAWDLGFCAHPGMPFLIRDETPRGLRVPQVGTNHHPNGISGIDRVSYYAEDHRVEWFKSFARSIGAEIEHAGPILSCELRRGRLSITETSSSTSRPVEVWYTRADGTSINHQSF